MGQFISEITKVLSSII